MKYYIIAGEPSGDLHGSKLIKEIESSIKPAGSYSIELNSANLSSGIYFINFFTDSYQSVQKITILK